MTTLSIIKADTGGFVGHSEVHPDMMRTARAAVADAVTDGLLIDGQVARCGDDISLIMTHEHGPDAQPVHTFAWDDPVRLGPSAASLPVRLEHGLGLGLTHVTRRFALHFGQLTR